MDSYILILLASVVLGASAWSMPFYPVHRNPIHVTRFVRPPRHTILPVRKEPPRQPEQPKWERPKHERDDYEPSRQPEQPKWERPKRERDDYDHHYDHDHDHKSTSGVTGPVHTFVKTDKNANYKWGVRHHVGNKYAS